MVLLMGTNSCVIEIIDRGEVKKRKQKQQNLHGFKTFMSLGLLILLLSSGRFMAKALSPTIEGLVEDFGALKV